jgi:hypothetical protein
MFGSAAKAWTAAIAVTTMAGLLGQAQPSGQPAPAANTAALSAALEGVEARRVRAHVELLADDLLEGRLPGTRGYDLASVERFTRANAALGYLIAMAPDAPAWKPGNVFGQTFGARR